MSETVFDYDESSDTLYVSFAPNEIATGVELNEHILLRLNKAGRRAVGITFFEYSVLAQKTEIGPRSFPLTGLPELAADLRELVIEILRKPPVSEILLLSAYTPSLIEAIPITFIHPLPIAGNAA
ncbi:MAG: DUF2283 domain-containing protein [Acidobacteria bacterium]|nr:DUF2283 domain-containing protein [Acidobacteriota bacterium]